MSYRRMPHGKWGAWRAENLARDFAHHRATLTVEADGTERLRWAKPRTGMYAVNYIATGALLVVTGDWGAALYQRHAGGLAWWGSLHLDYFAEKCIASPEGRHFTEWWEEAARDGVIGALSRIPRDKRGEFFRSNWKDAIRSQQAWHEWLNLNGYRFWNEPYELGDVGMVIAQACEAHLTGLKLALAQLAATATPAPEVVAA